METTPDQKLSQIECSDTFVNEIEINKLEKDTLKEREKGKEEEEEKKKERKRKRRNKMQKETKHITIPCWREESRGERKEKETKR